MKLFSLDSPLMNVLNKISDLMWLNILALLCCIPVVTAGASLTALHYMALKIVRDEECYIARGFFKSFKENFKQATIIWLIILVLAALIIGDFVIIWSMDGLFYEILRAVFAVIAVLLVFEYTFVFPVLAKFDNTIKVTMKNALVVSIVQFPKTILMALMPVAVVAIIYFIPSLVPIGLLFGLSASAFLSAKLYNKFFASMEERIMEAAGPQEDPDVGESIFVDESRLPRKEEQ